MARPDGLRHAAITDALDKTNGDVPAVTQPAEPVEVEKKAHRLAP